MKFFIFLIISFFLLGCSSNRSVYWCGDHECINNKEKEDYFKKTMIVEVRELNTNSKKDKSELDIMKKQAGMINEKDEDLKKLSKLEKKLKIKKEKELAKQAQIDQKQRIKEQKELAKQARLEEKRITKSKKINLETTASLEEKKITKSKKKDLETAVTKVEIFDFKTLIKKISERNKIKPYPNINNIPN